MYVWGLAPVPTPVHASVEDITSLQSVKKILLQSYGISKATLAFFFYIISLFGDGYGEGGRPP